MPGRSAVPGMPEWGMLPIPKALIKKGHRDMLRISDARMSGTSYGACILHVAPEAFVGGPLALLRTGDIVRLDLPNRRLDMLVDEAELDAPPQRIGGSPNSASAAAMAGCSRTMSARPTRAATSTISPPASAGGRRARHLLSWFDAACRSARSVQAPQILG